MNSEEPNPLPIEESETVKDVLPVVEEVASLSPEDSLPLEAPEELPQEATSQEEATQEGKEKKKKIVCPRCKHVWYSKAMGYYTCSQCSYKFRPGQVPREKRAERTWVANLDNIDLRTSEGQSALLLQIQEALAQRSLTWGDMTAIDRLLKTISIKKDLDVMKMFIEMRKEIDELKKGV